MTNLELQQEIARWQQCRARMAAERDVTQEKIAECDRALKELFRR